MKQVANRSKRIKPSAIREVGRLIQQQGDVVSFAGGWPDPAFFPTDAVAEITAHLMATEPHIALQYGATVGDLRLRQWLAQRMQDRYGMQCSADNVMITSGGQQGIFLTNALLINEGDVIVTEAPSFVGAFGPIQLCGGRMVGVEIDDDGINIAKLAELLQKQTIKYVYTMPEFQNPTGITLSLPRRRQLIELAEQHDFMILEDAPYSDLRYEGEPMPPVHALDPFGRTIYLGSFSKTFSPMRVGWLVAPAPLITQLTPIKQAIDMNTSTLTQSLIYHFCQRGLLDGQIANISAAYRHKRNLMLSAFDRHMPADVTWTNPNGGMFVWLSLPKPLDATDIFLQALAANIAVIPGNGFYPNTAAALTQALRLNWVSAAEDQIQSSMQTLAEIIKNAR